METKHVLFQGTNCGNCKEFIAKLNTLPDKNNFIQVDIQKAKRIPPNLIGVPAVIPMGTGETSLLQGSEAFRWLESLSQMNTSHRQSVHQTQPPQNVVGGQPMNPDLEPVSLMGSSLCGNFSESQSQLQNDQGNFNGNYASVGNIGQPLVSNMGMMGEDSSVRGSDGTSVKSRELDSRLKQLQSERDQIQNGVRRVG